MVANDDELDRLHDPADKLLLAALRDGTYVLAVKCRSCGAALTAKVSKAQGIGPACRRKGGTDAS